MVGQVLAEDGAKADRGAAFDFGRLRAHALHGHHVGVAYLAATALLNATVFAMCDIH